MAGQFDKYVKILGTGSRPDRFKGAPGNPDIVAPVEVVEENSDTQNMRSTGVTSSGIGDSMAIVNQQKSDRSKLAADEKSRTFSRIKKIRGKIQNENLSTTTMRLDEQTGEPYDSSEVLPRKANPVSNLLSKGYVKPNTSAKPADWQGNNPLSAEDAARMMDWIGAEARNAKYAADAAQESKRKDYFRVKLRLMPKKALVGLLLVL